MGTMGTLFRDLLFFQGYGDPALLEALARENETAPSPVPQPPPEPAASGRLSACG
jgi:hypothetical protein